MVEVNSLLLMSIDRAAGIVGTRTTVAVGAITQEAPRGSSGAITESSKTDSRVVVEEVLWVVEYKG